MAVWLRGDLRTSSHWQEVQALADDLLDESPLRDWTVVVRPVDDAGPWRVRLDADGLELTLTVPFDGDDCPDDVDSDDAASYIVFDLLDQSINPAD